MATQLEYIFRFASQTQAFADPIVEPFLVGQLSNILFAAFDTGSRDTVGPLSGYWCLVVTSPNVNLQNHPNLQFVVDRSQPAPFLVVTDNLVPPLFINNLEIITGYGWAYCNPGLQDKVDPCAPTFVKTFGGAGDGVTDNSAALNAFGTYGRASSCSPLVLSVVTGTYRFNETTAFTALEGIKDFIIQGSGTFQNLLSSSGPWLPDCFPDLHQDVAAVVELINTTSIGDTSVTLKTAANASRFPVGSSVVVMSEDVQISKFNFSYPPNCNLFDYVKVTQTNNTTGVVTLSAQLQHVHSDANIDGPATNPNPCGKARIWLLDTADTAPTLWDISHTYDGITIIPGPSPAFEFISMGGKFVEWRNCTIPGVSPSTAGTVNVINCTLNGTIATANEPDKIVDTFLMDGCTSVTSLTFQSSSINNVTIKNSTIDVFLGSGTPKNITIDNCITAQYGEGIAGSKFGHNLSTTINNTVIPLWVPFNFLVGSWVLGGANLVTIDGVSVTYANGIITVPKSTANLADWNVVPNVTHINLATTANDYFTGDLGTALVTSLTEDAVNIYYHMTGWPAALPAYANGNIYISRNGALVCHNLTGSKSALQATAATAAGMSPWQLLVDMIVQADGFNGFWFMLGDFKSITVTVTNPSVVPGALWEVFIANVVDATTMAGATNILVVIDITLAGTRTFTQAGLAGKQGNDDVQLGGVPQATMPVGKWCQSSPTWAYANGGAPTAGMSIDVSAVFDPGTQFRKAAP